MLIRFNEISPQGSHYKVQEVAGLAAQADFAVNGPLDIECTLKRKGESKVELQGHLRADLTLACDRCLVGYGVRIETDLQILFEVESANSWQVKELDYLLPDLDTVLLDEPVIDLDDVLRQQVYLALPMKNLCSEQCRGMCPQCGANLNLGDCGCAGESRKSPFAVLGKKKIK